MSLFDNFDWGAVASSVAGAAPSLIGTVMANRTATRGNSRAAQIAQGGNNAALEEMRAGRESAERTGAPGVQYLRNVVARDPGQITPAQQQAIADSQREFNRGPALKAYGGRAFSRMFADTTGRMRANAVTENQRNQQQAASTLSGVATQGRNMTPAIAQIQARGANIAAAGTAVNAQDTADTYGQIASVFANSVKEADRGRRYKEYEASYR